MEKTFPRPQLGIKLASQRTGLSAHVIRMWERRYRAVEPERTSTQRRLYSGAQVERLHLLRDLTQAGHGIGSIASLPTPELRRLTEEASPSVPAAVPEQPFLAECLEAIKAYDARRLEETLRRAETSLGLQGLLQKGIAPLARVLGEEWRAGSLTAAHEHFASSVLRLHLAAAARPFAPTGVAPVLAVVTPAGQLHELGALIVAAFASSLGWRPVYLGAGLPAGEIAGAAIGNRARAVALSIVYPEDDPHLGDELRLLRTLLPPEMAILAGGRAARAYAGALDTIGALQTIDIRALGSALDGLRRPGSGRRP